MKKVMLIIGLFIVLSFLNLLYAQEPTIILRLGGIGDEIINGKEIDIKVSAFNLENKSYDARVYIYRDNNENKVISENYYNIDWFYSGVYLTDFFIGPGNKTRGINISISEPYRRFNGSAKIKAKIKEFRSYDVLAETEEDINILDWKTEVQKQPDTETQIPTTGEVIKIEVKGNATETPSQPDNNSFIYISVFIVLIILFLMLLMIRIFR